MAWALAAGVECLEVSEAVLGKLASKDNPQSMLGVFKQRWADPPPAAKVAHDATWVALEEVRDPGNLGTIIRTVDAVGAAGIILIGSSCDPYSHECVRATMGSVFAVPLVRMTREAFLGWANKLPGDIVGTHLDAEEDFRKAKYRFPGAIADGQRGPRLVRSADRRLHAPRQNPHGRPARLAQPGRRHRAGAVPDARAPPDAVT